MNLAERYQEIQARITQAARAVARDPKTVRLLVASKHQSIASIQALLACGQHDFGENTVQEALPKIEALSDQAIHWHYIGRIQSNKTRDLAAHFSWVHSVESLKIAQRLSSQRQSAQTPLNLCLQVNLSGEASKAGVGADALPALAAAVAALPHLKLRGLMTMAPAAYNAQACEDLFKRVAALQAEVVASGIAMDHLSMGMSADYEPAIHAGATWVRLGSALFNSASVGRIS